MVHGCWVAGHTMVRTPDLNINPSEFSFSFSRSSGAGGQNVNKVNSRVTLSFDIQSSSSLDDAQKRLIHTHLAHRINRHGVLRVSSDVHRTQEANRKEVVERFTRLVTEALRVQRPRKKTRIPARERRRRLDQKKRRGWIKKLRGSKGIQD